MAFTSPAGHWDLESVPFGFKKTPSSSQKIINTFLSGLIGSKAQVYLDDILIIGETFSEHINNLKQVLERLKKAKLTIKMEKCVFSKRGILFKVMQ